jgi:membrane protease YdiL (CAAX protease family)
METPAADANSRAAHGGLLVLAVGLLTLVPGMRTWPLHLLAPLLVYFLLVALIPPLRRTFRWLTVGRLSLPVLACTAAVVVVSSAALVVFQYAVAPDLRDLRAAAPAWAYQAFIPFLIVFSLVNALLEELIFRGAVLDALESQIGLAWALPVQAAVFGYGHMLGGYPPTPLGAVLAGVYGVMLGLLKVYSRGLAAPFLAHIFADATIVLMVFRPE